MCVLHSKETAYDYLQFKSITEMLGTRKRSLTDLRYNMKVKNLAKLFLILLWQSRSSH